MKKILIILNAALLLLLATPAFAISNPASGLFVNDFGGSNTFSGIVMAVIQNILLPIVGIISVLFIIIGGFQYITSGANEELAETGKKTLTNAIIGLVIVILSYIIVTVIINALKGKV